ncbi:Sodium/calcium exchanger protein-domain-containing protein [Durotheca rogersii]|uniref:Sodium/calcium exchanger protein-domain-containing protein n=1 Tax=Durotheca rogersii TaxID=419775 RepID=UPI00221F0F91|nr:Sodium/calcium exchanger protein-domain-containing protein [Durotheca rogersii]KAI5861794.1 Sodium/calcium exchanger protein-domain-containing protein [Durotheca rogersii]
MDASRSRKGRKRGFSPRPFYTVVFLLTLLTTYSLLVRGASGPPEEGPRLGKRSGEDCHLVHSARDKCDFVRRNCRDDEPGIFEYLTFYYCGPERARPVAFMGMVIWLGLLFSTIGLAASDFFSVNLSTISTVLGLSESLAGVTFLAFGNGSPDVFSTFAAMGSNSGSMAVGELIGAAGFITSVVAGSMALVREFRVSRKTFVRDICFFIASVSFAMGFLADGNLYLWECGIMIGFYIFYVIVVVSWHAITKRRKAQRARESLSRSHFYAASSGHSNDELEPYRDDPDDDDTTPSERRTATPDISALERAPRIEIGSPDDDDDDDDDNDHRQHVAAEMTSSMRINRPRGRRSNTTITPIRPSLVGALEFRSVLSSLQEEGNVRMRPILHARSTSADLTDLGLDIETSAVIRGRSSAQTIQGVEDASAVTRNRSLSSGAILSTFDASLAPPEPSEDRGRRTPSPHVVDGKLAPPLSDQFGGLQADASTKKGASDRPPLLHLRVPSSHGSERSASTSTLSPFPAYTDSPPAGTPTSPRHPHSMLPTPREERDRLFPPFTQRSGSKPIWWWPYRLLPSPYIIFTTLFPTLQGWRSKGIWDKFVSVISVPSIFLLVITLPVVENETPDDDLEAESVADEAPLLAPSDAGNTAAPTLSLEVEVPVESETEWQRYRRRTRSTASSRSRSPSFISLAVPGGEEEPGQDPAAVVSFLSGVPMPKPVSELGQGDSTVTDDEPAWNRWLLILQIFTGPLFCVCIVWVNMAEDLDRPLLVLVKASLMSLVCSLVLLALLLVTTSPDRRPKYYFMFCFLGFCIAIAWISTIAGEVVGVLKAFGVILNISEAILGLTVFAVGNSVGDLVADVTVARLGYPVMALSACFGGPLLNILLGIGLGGAYQAISAAKEGRDPDTPIHYRPYRIQVTGTLMVSAITLLFTLLALLAVIPINKWIMSRKIGWSLIGLWSISTVMNLVIEITGVWSDIA